MFLSFFFSINLNNRCQDIRTPNPQEKPPAHRNNQKPSCSNPGQCGTFVITNDPSCGDLGRCTCAKDADGRSICVKDVFCTAQQCTADTDCASGEVCWTDNC